MTTATIASDREEAAIGERLEAHRLTLSGLRAHLDQTEAGIADLLVSRTLGGHIDSKRLTALTEQRARLEREISDGEAIAGGLAGLIADWRAAERFRRYVREYAEAEAISAAAPDLEARAHAAMVDLVAALSNLHRERRRFDAIIRFVNNVHHELHGQTSGLRGPLSPPVIPDQYFKFAEPPLGDFSRWLRLWRTARGR